MRYRPTPLRPDSLTVAPAHHRRPAGSRGDRAGFRVVVLLTALAGSLAWLVQTWRAPAPPVATPPAATDPVPLDGPRIAARAAGPDVRPPEQRYLERIRTMYAQAMHDGVVSYAGMLQSAYEPGVLTRQVVARKSAYRKRQRLPCTFLADYRLAGELVTVKEGRAVHDPLLRGWMRGLHSRAENLIIVTRGSPATILCHEIGHALQKHAWSQTNVSDGVTYAAFRDGRIDDAGERRLRYLADQREIEVSLQDLNRLHAVVLADRPIMDPYDAIRALTAIGLPLTFADVQRAFADQKRTITLEEFARSGQRAPEKPGDRLIRKFTFGDAHRLVELRTLALRVDPALWPPLLRKLIFEAPGHL